MFLLFFSFLNYKATNGKQLQAVSHHVLGIPVLTAQFTGKPNESGVSQRSLRAQRLHFPCPSRGLPGANGNC